ncbi:hypothetical protein L6164_015177 [Bauhinia variegata]|uniref:Uncharacterized protein n=1 Tax=Bauhinia variegata TaxID=167791 RepID=A0ACB9NL15_BAUVA|nr:hypothetical protein L6164_015177 [Bauhinia variegata]
MASIWTLQFGSVSVGRWSSFDSNRGPKYGSLRNGHSIWKWFRLVDSRDLSAKASASSGTKQKKEEEMVAVARHPKDKDWNPIGKFHQLVRSMPPITLPMNVSSNGKTASEFVIWLCVATVILVGAARVYVGRKSRYKYKGSGSVADLVRRGQLRSDTRGRGISRSLKYEDPFNNPLVKVGKSKSTIEMCGKVYRLAPVTLTQEQRAIHQKRRSRAYQWKRPTMFLKEGDSVPPHVDPDTIRWIPANHPFATTAPDIDEDLAQNNVYQKHGVPFRIQAEHEALQRKLEALQNDQKLNKLVIDPANAKDLERPFRSPGHTEKSSVDNQSIGQERPSTNSTSIYQKRFVQ